ncbi:major histocompatibility complex class I-related gene protein isoform X2 [Astyanax mexicanus]|uniref:major histocompatibility complex class I-related gene protein isoform X2 n=1 Tax=Astyanax mexicanus TaxID=7994 RepID=UPI0020CB677E|nr:major histocompatibility complex class I-related gene protein isoform X2 [Astyanax mexicanus]
MMFEHSKMFFQASLYLSHTTHSLQFFFTIVTPVISIPEFTAVCQVDEEQVGHYDSNNRTVVITADWLKKDKNEEQWELPSEHVVHQETLFRTFLAAALEAFNWTEKELHTLQRTIGCQLDDDGSKRGYDQFGYDGEDLVRLDLNSGTWITVVPQVLPLTQTSSIQLSIQFIQHTCIDWLQKCVKYGKSVLERKDPPEVSVFQKNSSSPVVCHATGFFPKAVMISWQKNGEELNEDVELRETLPNQDGSFQKRSILTLSPEELKNSDKYTCVVQHSSMENELVLLVSDRKVLSGNGVSVGLIVGVMVGALLLVVIICTAVFIWKRKSSEGVFATVRDNGPSVQQYSVAVKVTKNECLTAGLTSPVEHELNSPEFAETKTSALM